MNNLETQSPENGAYFVNSHEKTQFKLNQTLVVQVWMSSEPCYETLT